MVAKGRKKEKEKEKEASSEALCKPPALYFIIVFWGDEFRRIFLDYTVASLLSPNNVPSILNKPDSKILIATSEEDWRMLQDERLFKELTKHIEAVWFDLGDRYYHWKYKKMAYGHRLATTYAWEHKTVGIHLNPDTIFPDGSIKKAETLVRKGMDLVLCGAVRFKMEECIDELTSRGLYKAGKLLNVSMREATEIGIKHLHSETRGGNFNARNFGELHYQHGQTHFPICCYFVVPNEDGIVIFGHNWSPFVMNYAAINKHDQSSFELWTIDGSYAFDNFDHRNIGKNIHVVRDSDELFLLGMTPRDDMAIGYDWRWWKGNGFLGQWNKGYLINWVVNVSWMDDFRRAIYPLSIRWHSRDLNANWDPVEKRASKIVNEYSGSTLNPRRLILEKLKSRSFGADISAGLWLWTGLTLFVRSGPRRGLRFLWYCLMFWRTPPDVKEVRVGKFETIVQWADSTTWRKIKRGLNRLFVKNFIILPPEFSKCDKTEIETK